MTFYYLWSKILEAHKKVHYIFGRITPANSPKPPPQGKLIKFKEFNL